MTSRTAAFTPQPVATTAGDTTGSQKRRSTGRSGPRQAEIHPLGIERIRSVTCGFGQCSEASEAVLPITDDRCSANGDELVGRGFGSPYLAWPAQELTDLAWARR